MIQKYDTLKDTSGQTWRVVSVGEDGNTMEVKGVNENGKLKPGRTRTIRKEDIGQEYRLLDLPKVTVTTTAALEEQVKEILASGDPDAINELIISDAEKMLEMYEELERLRLKIEELEEENETLKQAAKDLRKTISKMHQEHDSEVAELNDRIMELEILAKKKNEYADALDEDAIAFENMHKVARAIVGMADSIGDLAYMIQNETEARS